MNSRSASLLGAVLLFNASPALAQAHDDTRWNYLMSAEEWVRLDASYEKCLTGIEQSPVNIILDQATPSDIKPPQLIYGKSGKAKLIRDSRRIELVLSTRHSVKFQGKHYILEYIALHSPGEHTLDFKAEPMELEFYHRSDDGRRLVISTLATTVRNAVNPTLEKVLETAETSDNKPQVPLTFAEILPSKRTFLMYQGSLTAPPCTEELPWLVLREPITLSPEQFSRYARMIGRNAREQQQRSPLNVQLIE